jgi:Fe-S oxidoreductase/nitrate reductase gamma subunit
MSKYRRLTMIFAFVPLEGGYQIPMRIVGANIYYEWLIYIFMFIPVGLFIYGVYKRIQIWMLAKGTISRNDRIGQRIKTIISYTLSQKLVLRKPVAGSMHFLLFWGFVLLFIATVSFAMWDKIGFPPLVGNIYVGFSALIDVMGFAALIAIIILAIIRYVQRPKRLDDTKPLDGWILLLIGAILLSGYIVEGLRIAGQINLATTWQQIAYERVASPIGWIFAGLFTNNFSLENILSMHRFNWWLHMAISFLFIAMIPYTKLWHIFTGMLSYFFRNMESTDISVIENIGEAETFGVEQIEELHWKDLLDLDACIRCGRCQEACPAYNTGKKLNPKITVIQTMKKHLDEKAPYLLQAKHKITDDLALTINEVDDVDQALAEKSPKEQNMLYDIVSPEVLWACTNCRACIVHCPMSIEHLSKITDMRRNLVMWQGDIPAEAQTAFTNLERNYNPWGVGWASRAKWLEERKIKDQVKILSEDPGEFEYLLFGGCAVAFDDRYKKVGEVVVKLLNLAGVKFAYLGTEEMCCGDPARRLGNEYLFQVLAQQNIENFEKYGVKKIICLCPHGYNTIKNEYPFLNGNYEVYHYTEILAKLLADGLFNIVKDRPKRISYHDSCFLGRYNDIYQAPRRVINQVGGNILEIDKSKQFSFCCGAGGGRMFLEENVAEGYKRINETRAEQFLEDNPDILIGNCPFCLTMLTDGVKALNQEQVAVFDLAEYLWDNLGR